MAMETIIYFEENGKKHGVIRFVSGYRKKRFLRKERIEYTFSSASSKDFIDEEEIGMVLERIKKDYPDAVIHLTTWDKFLERYKKHVFWLIAYIDDIGQKSPSGYYSGSSRGNVEWTNDIEDAEIGLDDNTTDDTVNNIRKSTGKKVFMMPVYLDLVNGLLEPNFMITCTGKKGKQETKYFARMEGARLRLNTTSDAAKKFTYKEVLAMFEFLQSNNKNFLYAALPVFKENVHYKQLDNYLKKNKVSRMVQMTTKLRWMNR